MKAGDTMPKIVIDGYRYRYGISGRINFEGFPPGSSARLAVSDFTEDFIDYVNNGAEIISGKGREYAVIGEYPIGYDTEIPFEVVGLGWNHTYGVADALHIAVKLPEGYDWKNKAFKKSWTLCTCLGETKYVSCDRHRGWKGPFHVEIDIGDVIERSGAKTEYGSPFWSWYIPTKKKYVWPKKREKKKRRKRWIPW